jgi:hypothetical protein
MAISRFLRPGRAASRAAGLLAALTVAPAVVGAPATAQPAPGSAAGYEYTFRISSGEGDPSTGRAWVSGSRMRVEMDRKKDGAQYLIVDREANQLLVVHPEREEYSVTDPASLEQVVGTAMRQVDRFLTMRVNDAVVSGEHVGRGEPVVGLPTERYRLVQQYHTEIGIMGRTARTNHRVVTEYSTSTAVALPDNPVFGLASTALNALALHDRAFVRRTADVRSATVRGAPLRIAVTASRSGDDGSEQDTMTIEVTSLRRAAVPDARFAVPAGYREKPGGMSFSF